ncbi:AAA family ATPase [Bradyrhizobium sp. Cp5.3]|uniref:AAA family ATPase n=1 Tax=Bradyrhizobium sp. Cp5.3 TaxID=443598 RepID=UPI0018DC9629|nr:AAA family ATPase [Bradyrhizobium sp. Cp5.3]
MKKRVLVVARETTLRAEIARALHPAGYSVELAAGEKRALELIANEQISTAIVVSDPGAASLAFVRQLADKIPSLIVLAERPEDIARLKNSLPDVPLYKSRPLDEPALLKHLTRLMRPPVHDDVRPTPAALSLAGCKIDFAGRSFIHADGRQVALTRAEASLLIVLANSPGAVLSRDELSRAIGGNGVELYGRSIDVLIGRLRRKIEPVRKVPRFILTVSGGGYKFAASTPAIDGDSSATERSAESSPAQQPAGYAPDGSAPGLPHAGSERRQVTVLSFELIGPTDGASSGDPERFASTLQRFQDACASVISNANGFTSGVAGHEVLALFGYPKAHEDDAERAVRAGLDLVTKVAELASSSGEPVHIRVGIATGLVVITDQRAVGQPSAIAPRLRNIASTDSVLVAASTQSLLGNAFICGEPRTHEFVGVPERVTAFLVTGRNAFDNRFSAKRGPRLTKFVGRQHELRQLMAAWKNVKAGKGQAVLLCGEAGIGKSRVCEVVLQRICAEPHTTMRYQCAPHHANSPFHPIIEQLERAAQFEPGDTPAVKLKKLGAALSESGTAAPADILSCANLLSIPTVETATADQTPHRKKDLAISALIRMMLGSAREVPLVVELADAHWADSSTLELFGMLIASIKSAHVFVLMSFRPEFFPPWLDEPYVTMLRLDRLGREPTETIILDVARRKSLPLGMLAQIVSKTDGVPLFVEELTKSVMESGLLQDTIKRPVASNELPTLAIPATLLDSLTARLDRLGPVKKVAQIGAVIGREFSYPLLAAVAPLSGPFLEAALAQLAAPELVFVRGEPPNSVYVFKHALVQDAAYGTLLRSERQQLHGRIADAIEGGFPELVESQPELLAHHFIQAGLTVRAIGYLRKAGQRAIERSATSEAKRHLTRALELLQAHPEGTARKRQALELEVMLGQALIASHGYAAPETGEALLRAKALIDDSTDPAQKLAILYGIWAGYYVGGQVARQTEAALEFLAEAERHHDSGARCVAHRIVGTTYLTKGDFKAALPYLTKAKALYDPRQHALSRSRYGQDIGAAALCYLSWALWHLGLFEQASQIADAAVNRSNELSDPHTSAFTICHARGLFEIFGRSARQMRTYAELVVTSCRDHGLSHWMACGRILEGWASICEGDFDQGIELLQSGIANWQKAGARLWLPLFLALEAEAHAKHGDMASARTTIEKAIAVAEKGSEQWFLAELLRLKAGLLPRIKGTAKQMEALYVTSLQIAERQQARCWELRTACDLASFWRRSGRAVDAIGLLQPIYDQFTEGFNSTDLRRAQQILHELKSEQA